MTKIDKTENVWAVVSCSKKLFVIEPNRDLYMCDINNVSLKIKLGACFETIYNISDNLWAFNYEYNTTVIFNGRTGEEEIQLPFVVGLTTKYIKNEDTFGAYIGIGNENYYGVVDIENKKIKYKIENTQIFCSNKKVGIQLNEFSLSQIDLTSGVINWQLNFLELLGSPETYILGKVLEYNGLLYCSLNDNIDKKGIFAIDIETGQVVNRTSDVVGRMKLANDKIFIIKDAKWVIVLDPLSLQYEKIDFSPLLSPLGLNLGRRHLEVIVNNYLYFVSEGMRGGSEATVGIIDISKKELLWRTPIPIEEGSYWVKEIQVHEDRLFVLTQGGTLHIFGNE
jgi:hypothetical protein